MYAENRGITSIAISYICYIIDQVIGQVVDRHQAIIPITSCHPKAIHGLVGMVKDIKKLRQGHILVDGATKAHSLCLEIY